MSSPTVLRIYAAGLVLKAIDRFPGLLTSEDTRNYVNRLLSARPDADETNACTPIVTNNIVPKLKGSDACLITKLIFARIMPLIRDL